MLFVEVPGADDSHALYICEYHTRGGWGRGVHVMVNCNGDQSCPINIPYDNVMSPLSLK